MPPLDLNSSPSYLKERTFKLYFQLPETWGELIPKKIIPKKVYRNPIYIAREWQEMLDSGIYRSKADLAKHLGVSRVRVFQIVDLLKLYPEVINKVSALGETFTRKIIGEKTLRPLVCLTPDKQMEKISLILKENSLT